MVKLFDQRAQRIQVGILLIGIQRDPILMGQLGEFLADPGQALGIMRGVAIELELEVARAGVFAQVGNAALTLDLIVHADRVADRDALQAPASSEKARNILIAEIARQPRTDAGDIARHPVEEVGTDATQQRVQNGLVDFGRPIGGRERWNVLFGAGLDLRPDAGRMQAERGLETGMRQIKLARDQQRAPQFRDRCLRRQMRPFVEPLCDQELFLGLRSRSRPAQTSAAWR